MHKEKNVIKIGVDTGGTFTDIIMSVEGSLWTHKVLSTPRNPAHAVIKGVSEILDQHNIDSYDSVDIVHGSTVATNALLERRGAGIALVTTKGFEDVLEIGRQARPNLYDIFVQRPESLVPAERRFGIRERTLHTGEIQTKISTADLKTLTSQLATLELDAIAICFLFSYVNPKNEQIVADHLTSLNIPISCSHEILPEYREYARFSTTVANAYIRPTLERHLSTLTESESFPKSFRLMLSNGGCISTRNFESAGIQTVLSGPAGGVIGAYHIAKTAGYGKIITFDMGGTSTDVSLCDDGISMTTESTISGLPIKVPLIDIHTVGAGGGSIATVDSGGALRVGPESAGADPGPICYGYNGKEITVTDANLFLGRISPTQFLGGQMSLAYDATREYIEKFSERIGLSPLETADGILKIANSAMERAIKVISVERGFDTRDFTLVSFGGAGGLHAAFLAENLGIRTVLIPPNGGLLSAYGVLFADVVKDYSQTVLWKTEDCGTNLHKQLENGFDALLTLAKSDMKTEGFALSQLKIKRSLDMRYEGQSYELNVSYIDVDTDFVSQFHTMHEQRFSYARPDATIEVVTLRLSAIGETEKPMLASETLTDADPSDAQISQSDVIFNGEVYPTIFYQRESLRPGNRIKGPAIITEFSATTVVPPNFSAVVDEYGNVILQQE
ncbi:MAG: hydantoinase/oxoprolinase family protein [Candidatus Poribacteria bacterium]|nr:hydantoinase/oxoprolinase family protein [Candidatus Poribacteria bacterium]